MNEPKKRIKLDDINLVIFDMDGLIFDTESIYIRKGYEITKRYGYDITEEIIMKTIGMTDKSSREIYKAAYGQDFPYDLMTKEIDSYIVDLGRKGELPFMNGAIEIFEYFKNNDKKMVVATSSRREKAEILLKNSEIIKPLLRGRDIKKYGYEFGGMYIINTHNNPPVDIENYPIIKEHLEKFKNELSKRPEVKDNKYPWYAMSRYGSGYSDDFKKNKIFWAGMSNANNFLYSSSEIYINDKGFLLTGESLKYILALLNSKLCFYYYKFDGIRLATGWEFKKFKVEEIPIPKIDEESQKPFIKLVDEILEAKQKIKDYKPLLDEAIKNNNFDREIALKKELENLENICTTNEKTIDQMVYKLYDLTPDEIKIVENK